MSEPMGVEERARLRALVNAIMPSSTLSESIIALLDEVDRLNWELASANAQADRFAERLGEQAHVALGNADLKTRLIALADEWRVEMTGARQRANTNEDFAAIRQREQVRYACAVRLRAELLKGDVDANPRQA